MLLQGREGGWQLLASSSLSKLFIDLAALHSVLSTPDYGLCLSRTPMSHFLSVGLRTFCVGEHTCLLSRCSIWTLMPFSNAK